MTNQQESEGQQNANLEVEVAQPAESAARAVTDAMQQAEAFVARFGDAARADACVGPAQVVGKRTVIPLGSVSLQGGFGMGFGGGSDKQQGQGSGGGGGGGGRGSARVFAVVDINEGGVSVRPIADATSIALAFMALIGLTILTLRGHQPGGLLRVLRRQP